VNTGDGPRPTRSPHRAEKPVAPVGLMAPDHGVAERVAGALPLPHRKKGARLAQSPVRSDGVEYSEALHAAWKGLHVVVLDICTIVVHRGFS
jgi:hypothetical protein